MAKRVIDESTLTNIGDAIREKRGTSSLILPENMPSEILSIDSGAKFACGTNTWGGTTAKTYTLSGLPFKPKVAMYSAPTKGSENPCFSSFLIDTTNNINLLTYVTASGGKATITTANSYFDWGLTDDGFYLTLKTTTGLLWWCSGIEKPWVCIG